LRYGGNTSCVEVRTSQNEICIFDAGTGLRALGKRLVREFGYERVHAAVFLSHYHWDHIQGIPMFEPLYHPANHFYFYSFPSHSHPVQETLEGQMREPYFPVQMDAMRAQRSFHKLERDVVEVGGAAVRAMPLNHPQGCLGYRVESAAGIVVYATDNEAGSPQHDRNLRDLAAGADALIIDAQYTPLEYTQYRRGWGHSTWQDAVNVASDAGVRCLVLYHHDPDHNDAFLDAVVEEARKRFPHVAAATEGTEIDLNCPDMHPLPRTSERRRQARRQIGLPVVVEGRQRNGLSFIESTVMENISFGGASFLLSNEPDPRRHLQLHIKLSSEPFAEASTISLDSRIVRSQAAADGDKHEIAVRFPSMNKP
jgi:phosphoribosyl 1,2-cyclic phosphodiesterase